jgi:hypothetical protein
MNNKVMTKPSEVVRDFFQELVAGYRRLAKDPETFGLRIGHVAIGVPDLKATVAWYL